MEIIFSEILFICLVVGFLVESEYQYYEPEWNSILNLKNHNRDHFPAKELIWFALW